MRCAHVALFGLLLLVIVGILIVIWYFEGPDQGGYDQYKEPAVDRGISTFLGAYLPLLLLPFLLFFVLLICYLRLRAQKQAGDAAVDLMTGAPVGPTMREPISAANDCLPTTRPPMIVAPAPVRGDATPPPLPHHNSARPIPPLPEFHEARSTPTRAGLPSYDTVVYTQLCASPIPPGAKKPPPPPSPTAPQVSQQQQQQQQLPLQQQSMHEGTLTPTPVFDRAGMRSAHSATSISRGRVGRAVNKDSKESAL